MRVLSFAAASLAGLIALGAPAHGERAASLSGALAELRAQDLRVATAAFRLSTANAELCDDRGPQWGMTLHAASQYGPRLRADAVAQFGLRDAVSISTVVAGGPSDRAGLRPGDEILAVGDAATPSVRPRPADPASWSQVGETWTLLNRTADGAVLSVRRGDEVFSLRASPAIGCAYDIQLMPSAAINASADGAHVFVTSAFAAYAADDDDLALVLGHEYAHDVLHHRARLDANGFLRSLLGNLGSSPAQLNRVEREADYVGLYLTARAGYDVSAANSFWRRLRRDLGDNWYARWSHPGPREREANAAATAEEISAIRASGGPLVWDRARYDRR